MTVDIFGHVTNQANRQDLQTIKQGLAIVQQRPLQWKRVCQGWTDRYSELPDLDRARLFERSRILTKTARRVLVQIAQNPAEKNSELAAWVLIWDQIPSLLTARGRWLRTSDGAPPVPSARIVEYLISETWRHIQTFRLETNSVDVGFQLARRIDTAGSTWAQAQRTIGAHLPNTDGGQPDVAFDSNQAMAGRNALKQGANRAWEIAEQERDLNLMIATDALIDPLADELMSQLGWTGRYAESRRQAAREEVIDRAAEAFHLPPIQGHGRRQERTRTAVRKELTERAGHYQAVLSL